MHGTINHSNVFFFLLFVISTLNQKKITKTNNKQTNKQVARALVHLHSELLAGRTQALETLLALPELMPLGQSMRELVDRDGSVVATASAARRRRSGGGGGNGGASSSSSDDDDDEMSDDDAGVAPMATPIPAPPARAKPPPPQIDEDGFQTVVRGRRR